MKFVKTLVILGILAGLSFASTIGFIDVEQVFTGYSQTKSAQDEINNKMRDYQRALSKYQQELEIARIDGKSERDIERIRERMQKELDPKEAEIRMLNEEQMSRIRRDIVTAVEAVAKEVGISVVVDKQVIIAGGIDITETVITRLNRRR